MHIHATHNKIQHTSHPTVQCNGMQSSYSIQNIAPTASNVLELFQTLTGTQMIRQRHSSPKLIVSKLKVKQQWDHLTDRQNPLDVNIDKDFHIFSSLWRWWWFVLKIVTGVLNYVLSLFWMVELKNPLSNTAQDEQRQSDKKPRHFGPHNQLSDRTCH